jgi:hypothetical protein
MPHVPIRLTGTSIRFINKEIKGKALLVKSFVSDFKKQASKAQRRNMKTHHQFILTALAVASLTTVTSKAQTFTFDNSSSATFTPSSSFGYNPTVPNFRYNYGSANSSATFQWSSSDAGGSPTSGSIEASLTLNETLDTSSTKGAFNIDLAGGSGINAGTLSFDLMISPGSAVDQYGGYGDLGISTATGSWGTQNSVWDGPSPETSYEFGTSWGVPYTAGSWYHFNIPLSSAAGTGINAIVIQDYDGGGKLINGTINFFIDNLTLTPVPEPSTIALAGLGIAGLFGLRRISKN